MNTEGQNTKMPIEPTGLQPRQCVTIFDLFHIILTLTLAVGTASVAASRGWVWAVVAFLTTGIATFFIFGYGIGAFVLFLYRRYTPECRIGYEANCYVMSHFKPRNQGAQQTSGGDSSTRADAGLGTPQK